MQAITCMDALMSRAQDAESGQIRPRRSPATWFAEPPNGIWGRDSSRQ
jgi:hypothetical protein